MATKKTVAKMNKCATALAGAVRPEPTPSNIIRKCRMPHAAEG
jgi:hypothetical protein